MFERWQGCPASPHPKQKQGADLNVHQLEGATTLAHPLRSPNALLGFGGSRTT